MTKRDRQILALLQDDPTLPAAAIARRLKTRAATVTARLGALRLQGAGMGRDQVRKPLDQVIVVGGANIDIKCRASAPIEPRTSNPGSMAVAVGGVACNIARNLARLGVPTALLTVVGQDAFGERVLRELRETGIDVSMILSSARPTGTYTALLDRNGELAVAVSAMDAMDDLTAQRLAAHAAALTRARMVVADCNVAPAVLARLAELCARARVPLALDAVSTRKAERLRPLLRAPLPIHLMALNRDEAALIAAKGLRSDRELRRAAGLLHRRGVQHILLGLGERGTFASNADDSRGRTLPPLPAAVVDVTGAGDAAVAGTIYGLLNGQPLPEAARWGQAAAALTVSVRQTVNPAMSPAALQGLLRRRAPRGRRRELAR